MVSCDVSGPIGLKLKHETSSGYTAFTVFNHRVGVKSLAVSQYNGTGPWQNITRQNWNEFEVYPSSGTWANVVPLHVRVTSIMDEQITVIVPQVAPDLLFYGPSQFAPVPSGYGGSSTGCCEPPYKDFAHIFEDNFLNPWQQWNSGGSIDTTTAAVGSASYTISLDAWATALNVGTNIGAPTSQFQSLHFYASFV